VIESVSWGGGPAYSGYIAINGNKVISSTISGYRGFNLVRIDVSSCSASNIVHYDTNINTANSENMATYINSLPSNTVLVGITADDAQGALTLNAKSALLAIGVDVNGLQFRGKVCFMAQVGQPAMTVSQVDPPGVSNLMLTVEVIGKLVLHKLLESIIF
jgi:Interleukin-like EMT inducer